MKSLVILLVCTFLIGACSSNEVGRNLPEEMPVDFNFVLKYGFEARDIINTYENTYTKNMVLNDDETIEMILSDEEKKVIYEKMRAVNILNSADNASETTCADPHERNKLNLTLNGEEYQREWITSYCNNAPDEKLKEFTEFLHREIIMTKEEYNDLPEASGGYD